AAFFSYSRIYVGAHYPFDIIVGMIVGIFLSFSFSKMINKLLLKNKGEALKSL
ncbi:MAG: phosphatase PAP2 family protein, partial [Flavobacteriaceae bacterium]|nr:phosphatase PAP2 family protein [Flavobacteriaceae bacterium]